MPDLLVQDGYLVVQDDYLVLRDQEALEECCCEPPVILCADITSVLASLNGYYDANESCSGEYESGDTWVGVTTTTWSNINGTYACVVGAPGVCSPGPSAVCVLGYIDPITGEADDHDDPGILVEHSTFSVTDSEDPFTTLTQEQEFYVVAFEIFYNCIFSDGNLFLCAAAVRLCYTSWTRAYWDLPTPGATDWSYGGLGDILIANDNCSDFDTCCLSPTHGLWAKNGDRFSFTYSCGASLQISDGLDGEFNGT
jgi:hypothetical protein